MFLTCVDYFMCLGITISRIGIGAIVAILTLKHLGPVEPKLSWCYTRLQGNLQANLCLRVGGNTKLYTVICCWKQFGCCSSDVQHEILTYNQTAGLRQTRRGFLQTSSRHRRSWTSLVSLLLSHLIYSLYYYLIYYLTVGLVLVLRHYY